jgi:hypothetical protein
MSFAIVWRMRRAMVKSGSDWSISFVKQTMSASGAGGVETRRGQGGRPDFGEGAAPEGGQLDAAPHAGLGPAGSDHRAQFDPTRKREQSIAFIDFGALCSAAGNTRASGHPSAATTRPYGTPALRGPATTDPRIAPSTEVTSLRRQIGGNLTNLLRGKIFRILVHDLVSPCH